MEMLTNLWSAIKVRNKKAFCLKQMFPCEIHHQLLEVDEADVMSISTSWWWSKNHTCFRQVWFLCKEIELGKIDVRDKQRLGRTITWWLCVLCVEGLIRADHRIHLKDTAHFRTNAKVLEAVITWLRNLDSDFFYAGFDRLVFRWHKCSTITVIIAKSNIYQWLLYLYLSLWFRE